MDAENLLVSSRILIVDDDNYLRKVLITSSDMKVLLTLKMLQKQVRPLTR